jgi:hypothetical protein
MWRDTSRGRVSMEAANGRSATTWLRAGLWRMWLSRPHDGESIERAVQPMLIPALARARGHSGHYWQPDPAAILLAMSRKVMPSARRADIGRPRDRNASAPSSRERGANRVWALMGSSRARVRRVGIDWKLIKAWNCDGCGFCGNARKHLNIFVIMTPMVRPYVGKLRPRSCSSSANSGRSDLGADRNVVGWRNGIRIVGLRHCMLILYKRRQTRHILEFAELSGKFQEAIKLRSEWVGEPLGWCWIGV